MTKVWWIIAAALAAGAPAHELLQEEGVAAALFGERVKLGVPEASLVREVRGERRHLVVREAREAQDPEVARRLWEVSEEQVESASAAHA